MEAGKTTDLSGLSVLSLLFTTLLSGLFPSHYFSCFVSTKDRKPWPGRRDLTFTFLSFPPVLEQEFWVPPVLLVLRTQQGITTLPESSKRPQDGDVTPQT